MTPDPNNETDIVGFVSKIFSGTILSTQGTETISGTFAIEGTYCRPQLVRLDDVLEILVHGITYNKTMWSGLGFGNNYNWHTFANLRGYHTLAIDRLGHGTNQQRPDPFGVVEGALQVEIMHQLITKLRSNAENNPLRRKFKNIAYVGHSYGSFLGVAHARIYPTDIDVLALTGYSTSIAFSAVSNLQLVSASSLQPSRYPGTPPGYITTAQQAQREGTFYAGGYDRAIPPVDFAFEDTVTDGEAAGLSLLLQPAVGFVRPVLVVTGVNDALFCTPPVETCRAMLEASSMFFPNASDFQYMAVPDTGHCLTLHYSAPVTFARVHDYLDRALRF